MRRPISMARSWRPRAVGRKLPTQPSTSTGSAALANGGSGINFLNASGNTIGGSSSIDPTNGKLTGAGNLISGNVNSGVRIELSTANLVLGNFIGTDVTGKVSVSNGYPSSS